MNDYTSERTLTQREQILGHLQGGKSITPMEALNLYGCFRLGARIADLRDEGYKIKTTIVTGGGKHYASYKLEG